MSVGEPYIKKHKPRDSGVCYNKDRGCITTNTGTRYPKRIIEFNVDIKSEYHPSQKPIALLEYLIKTYTNEGDTVLDNCMGSGSTGVAAVNCKRNFIGYELDEEYFNIAKERILCN